MTYTISSQIDNLNFDADARFESEGVDSTPRTKSKAGAQNLITRPGGATLADFFVMLARQALPVFAHKPLNQTQGRGLQLNKILYKS